MYCGIGVLNNMNNKKMIFGLLLAVIGCIFSAFCFFYVVMHPCVYNGIGGLRGAFLNTDLTVPFVISMIVMIAGIVICGIEAFRKPTEHK